MAKRKSQQEQVIDVLRARGLRRKVAETVADAVGRAPKRQPPKAVQSVLNDLRAATKEIEDRVTGRPAKRKAAAQKAAATRKRAAAKRSAAAKKGAQTRAKRASSSTSGTRSRSRTKA